MKLWHPPMNMWRLNIGCVSAFGSACEPVQVVIAFEWGQKLLVICLHVFCKPWLGNNISANSIGSYRLNVSFILVYFLNVCHFGSWSWSLFLNLVLVEVTILSVFDFKALQILSYTIGHLFYLYDSGPVLFNNLMIHFYVALSYWLYRNWECCLFLRNQSPRDKFFGLLLVFSAWELFTHCSGLRYFLIKLVEMRSQWVNFNLEILFNSWSFNFFAT